MQPFEWNIQSLDFKRTTQTFKQKKSEWNIKIEEYPNEAPETCKWNSQMKPFQNKQNELNKQDTCRARKQTNPANLCKSRGFTNLVHWIH